MKQEKFDVISFDTPYNGRVNALVVCRKIYKEEREELEKEGLYCYSIRHADDGIPFFCEVAQWVFVNHFTDIICKTKLDLPEHPVIIWDNYNFEDSEVTLEEFKKSALF